jgi:A/G-specific adenine glycosylase
MILQQTKVDQGLPYYYRFLDKFPQINDLAKANESEVLMVWQGLGYYARARNMHATAKFVVEKHQGIFPTTYEQLLQLKGIGPYTAAAIASFAFHQAVPAIDGNVKRVVARFYGFEDNILNQGFFKKAWELLSDAIPKIRPDIFNQAMMELGALVCTPTQPKCHTCPINTNCIALQQRKTHEIPLRKQKVKVAQKKLVFIEFNCGENILLRQRPTDGIWGGLHEYPHYGVPVETPKNELLNACPWAAWKQFLTKAEWISTVRHKLSHQDIEAYHFRCILPPNLTTMTEIGFWVSKEKIKEFPLHRLMLKFVENNENKN